MSPFAGTATRRVTRRTETPGRRRPQTDRSTESHSPPTTVRNRRESYSSDVRVYLAVLILCATVSACGSGSSGLRDETPSSARLSPAAASRIERCVDRLLRNTTRQNAADKEAARRYARKTYCARFEEKGWVYEDGAVSIAAQAWLDQGATCVRGGEGEPTRTVPCEVDRSGGVQTLDCALLHIVRRSEVREYVDRLETNGAVKCDDGTALGKLGVP